MVAVEVDQRYSQLGDMEPSKSEPCLSRLHVGPASIAFARTI